MYSVKILADSKDPRGNRLTTFELVFPRIILSQFSKHRMFSFNTSSSRAVPFEKMVKSVQENPFIPIAWQKEHKGMQGTEYINEVIANNNCKNTWLSARDKAIQMANTLHKDTGFQVTKQLCNRLLEPFMWVKVIMTTSEEGLQNFFELRCPKYWVGNQKNFKSWKELSTKFKENGDDDIDNFSTIDRFLYNESQADIHIQKLAEMMWDAYNESTPEELESGWWHIPYLNEINKVADEVGALLGKEVHFLTSTLVAVSSALAARVSYTTIGSDFDIDHERLLKLHDRLVEDRHLSCFEHTARVMTGGEYLTFFKGRRDIEEEVEYPDKYLGWCNNLKGFIPYRYMIENGREI